MNAIFQNPITSLFGLGVLVIAGIQVYKTGTADWKLVLEILVGLGLLSGKDGNKE